MMRITNNSVKQDDSISPHALISVDIGITWAKTMRTALVSAPAEHEYGDPAEFFYDTPKEAIQHSIHLGSQFSLDTQYYPPRVTIIRGFEQHNGHADKAGYDCIEGVMTESMPEERLITGTELGQL